MQPTTERAAMAIPWDEKIVWCEKTMGTGVESIDKQHQHLIRMLNELRKALGQGEGRGMIAEILRRLHEYTLRHFGHEEGVMDACKCPVACANKDAHAQFVRNLTKIEAELAAEGPTLGLAMEVEEDLAEWLVQHISQCDPQLKKCVTPLSADPSPKA